MCKEAFIEKRFRGPTLDLIGQINAIIDDYQARGFVLTLRQLFYQLVARAIVENTHREYKRVGDVVGDGRLAGLIDWQAIEDRTRNLKTSPAWSSPGDIIGAAANSYREDLWRDQRARVEVWIEKDALVGVIEGVCDEYRVAYFACKGNNSQSEAYRAGQRMRDYLDDGLAPVVLHLGDHDPNGIDMTRDNSDRLRMFADQIIDVRRIALNIDQVEHYRPPPNFAKVTDSRCGKYVKKFGVECWELDALDPDVIADLIRIEIEGLLDHQAWKAAKAEEERNRALLAKVSSAWPQVETMIDNA